jgi:hypothetical protein
VDFNGNSKIACNGNWNIDKEAKTRQGRAARTAAKARGDKATAWTKFQLPFIDIWTGHGSPWNGLSEGEPWRQMESLPPEFTTVRMGGAKWLVPAREYTESSLAKHYSRGGSWRVPKEKHLGQQAYKKLLSPLIRDKLVAETHEVHKALLQGGITNWLCMGSLLGATRSGSHIPWEWDTDLCLEEHSRDKASFIVQKWMDSKGISDLALQFKDTLHRQGDAAHLEKYRSTSQLGGRGFIRHVVAASYHHDSKVSFLSNVLRILNIPIMPPDISASKDPVKSGIYVRILGEDDVETTMDWKRMEISLLTATLMAATRGMQPDLLFDPLSLTEPIIRVKFTDSDPERLDPGDTFCRGPHRLPLRFSVPSQQDAAPVRALATSNAGGCRVFQSFWPSSGV